MTTPHVAIRARHPTEIRMAVEKAFDEHGLIDYACAEIERLERAISESASAEQAAGEIRRVLDAKLAERENELLHACAIGMSTILTRLGAYENLSPYLRRKYDELAALHATCDRADVAEAPK